MSRNRCQLSGGRRLGVTETDTVPNEPGLLVAVSFVRVVKTHFPPAAGKTFRVPTRFVGASARGVSAEANEAEQRKHPVAWRFLRGEHTGGDDVRTDPPWVEWRVEIPSRVKDARKALEKHLSSGGGAEEFRWFVMLPGQSPSAPDP
jgi:hypothetical protein